MSCFWLVAGGLLWSSDGVLIGIRSANHPPAVRQGRIPERKLRVVGGTVTEAQSFSSKSKRPRQGWGKEKEKGEQGARLLWLGRSRPAQH